MALVAVKPSNPSLATSQELQWTEDGKMSAAFAKHREDLFAAKVGAAGESPTSWADENYQLNGGDQITARDIVRARAAFSAIQKKGVGNGKNSTTAWFKLGPTKEIGRFPITITDNMGLRPHHGTRDYAELHAQQ
jgi:hypothetical protein